MRRCALCCAMVLVFAASSDAATIEMKIGGAVVPVQAPDDYAQARVTLSTPGGEIIERRFSAKAGPTLDLGVAAPGDGSYRYRVAFDGPAAAVVGASGDGDNGRSAGPRAAWPTLERGFAFSAGKLILPDSGALELRPKDQVIADDLIVAGSACVGISCVNNEVFGQEAIRLKQDNTRIRFEDTSVGAFPGDDWQLTANDNTSGGLNRFSIENVTTATTTTPFTIVGAAPNNSIFVDIAGRVGLRTATPAQALHITTNDTPAMRLEQSAAGGFTAQTWEVAGNEANFFVRDITGGSRLPFRIRPGAPTSSIDISASGNVGIGTASPGARLDVQLNMALTAPATVLRVLNNDSLVPAGTNDRFTVDSSGNVTARGTISQLSSRSAKENFDDAEGPVLLARLETLRVPSWNYRGAPTQERHIGPVAEDFHQAFAVGGDPRFLAPADVAGVALASVKALQVEIKQRDARIADLELRLAKLEALLVEQR